MERNLEKLEDILNVSFNNKDILKNALVHRSYLNEHKSFALEHNERLEFLGDAVLELIVTDYLYQNYKEPEGVLTNWRSSLVNAKSLAIISEKLKIYDLSLIIFFKFIIKLDCINFSVGLYPWSK